MPFGLFWIVRHFENIVPEHSKYCSRIFQNILNIIPKCSKYYSKISLIEIKKNNYQM